MSKKVSILGDSISTFIGISNNPDYNETLKDYKALYDDTFKIENTWWYQVLKKEDYCLLVNNSYSGSSVSDIRTDPLKGKTYLTRANYLHNNQGIKPDIIMIYMGVNDLMDHATCKSIFAEKYFDIVCQDNYHPESNNFDEAYTKMMLNIVKQYKEAKIFCLTIPHMECNTKQDCEVYNLAIKKIAEHFKATVIDLYSSPISNYEKYTIDGVHPNKEGMTEMAKVVLKYIK